MMTNSRCTVCQHPKRASIDAQLLAGKPRRNIARYIEGVSKDSLARHSRHIGQAIVLAAARRGERIGDGLLDQQQKLNKRALSLLDDSERDCDGRLRAVAIAQVRENLAAEAKFVTDARSAGLDGMRFQVSYIKNWRTDDGPDGGERVVETFEKADGFNARLVSTESLGQVSFRSPAAALLLSVVAETESAERDAGATQQPESVEPGSTE